MLENGQDLLHSILKQASVHNKSLVDQWRLHFDLEEASNLSRGDSGCKVPDGFEQSSKAWIKNEKDDSKLLVSLYQPLFDLTKVEIDEDTGASRVVQNSYKATACDLKELGERNFANWEEVALKRVQEEESRHT